MSVTKDVTAATVKAETAAKVKDIADRQRIEVEHYGESLRIQREEAQYAQHKQTQTNNLGAFQVEKQAEVGVAGAEALGKMGANGAGNVNLSGGGDGFNMAAMMASMAVGGAVGQNIAGSMNNMMAGMNQPVQNGMTPPPVPGVTYYVVVNGQATGPYDLSTLKQMITTGQFTAESLVWKAGMSEWVKAGIVDDIKRLFPDMPPIPKENQTGRIFLKRDIGALQKAVIEASENRFWEEAVCEWEIMDCYIDENRKSVCICGQEGLKYCFTIQNRYNGNILYPIGSSCINQFGRNDLKQIVSVYEQMFNIRTKYYRREKIVLKDLSRRLLQFLYEEDIFRPTSYNNFNPEQDYKFLLSMFNQRTEPSARQQAKINAIIINNIIPYILRMEQ